MTKLALVQAFCRPKELQTMHVDVKRSLLKCNLRMLRACSACMLCIWNYTRKAKLKYQHVLVFTPVTFCVKLTVRLHHLPAEDTLIVIFFY